jgi:type I restriction enzyme, S subunit
MSSNLKKYTLTDAAEVLTGFPFKGNKYSNEGIRVVRGENVTIGSLRWDTIKCWNEPFKELEKYSLDEGDIVIGMDGSRVGKNRAQIRKDDLPLILAQRVARLRAKNNFSQDFLAYVIKSKLFEQYVDAIKTGTSIPHISPKQIKEFEFIAPEKKTQQRIASILSSLDDAIELNQQFNKTLEEMAKAIFKEWFVDFNFPNANGKFQETEIGKIPVGWMVGKLNEVLEIKYGKDHKNLESGEIPVYGSGGIMRYANKALYEFESILIPRKGTLTNLFYINKPFWSVDTMFYTKFKLANSGKYLFHLLQSLNLATMNVGSAVPSLTTEVLYNILIAVPTKEVLLKFEEVASSLFQQIEQNIEENKSLTNLRDTLLPKLMKGEININL